MACAASSCGTGCCRSPSIRSCLRSASTLSPGLFEARSALADLLGGDDVGDEERASLQDGVEPDSLADLDALQLRDVLHWIFGSAAAHGQHVDRPVLKRHRAGNLVDAHHFGAERTAGLGELRRLAVELARSRIAR